MIISCRNLSKRFGGVTAVDRASFDLAEGETLVILGPSGCGKSTLLRMIAGFERPDSGSLILRGNEIVGLPPERRGVGLVFQEDALFPHMNVRENIGFGVERSSRGDRIDEMLSLFELRDLGSRLPHELSGGQQQRVALARAMAPAPGVILLDEPFNRLDPHLRPKLRADVRKLFHEQNVSSIFVTHDEDEALLLGDRIAVMSAGRIEQIGTPVEIFGSPASPFVATFLGVADFLPARATQGGFETELGEFRQTHQFSEGEQIELMVRPDDVEILPDPNSPAKIRNKIFRGMHYLYAVALPSGAVVHALELHSKDYAVGEHVEVRLEPGHALKCFSSADDR